LAVIERELAVRTQPQAAAPLTLAVPVPFLAVKRVLDLVAALGMLLLLAPLLLAIAAAIRLESVGAPLYIDCRRGRNGCVFRMVKFRTMRRSAAAERPQLLALSVADPPLFKIRHDPRVTHVGKFLRRWSLDELPQLLNVVLGQMSLIGPRPLVVQEADALGDRGALRLMMRPGISGPWQVSGRAELPTDELVRLDDAYVGNWSMRRDLRLLASTLIAVLRGKGAY
jgi:lipopolysaccharide/colanic/teichoic acid biosynthesis glycosyltransferase